MICGDIAADLLCHGYAVRLRVTGRSMHPSIRAGAVITARPVVAAALRVGDVVLYRGATGLVAHRVVRIDGDGAARRFICRGDGMEGDDAPVSAPQIIGCVTQGEWRGRPAALRGVRATLLRLRGRLAARWRPVLRAAFLLGFALVAPFGLATPAPAQSFKVGSFTKSTAAATVSQTVSHGLGVTPKAIIFWTNAKTNETFNGDYRMSMGFTDTSTSRSTAIASQDNQGTTNASRRIAQKALTIVQWGETVVAEADLTSVDSTNFTLSWTTNNNQAYVIHFFAIGGSGVQAKVIDGTMATATGNQSFTGIGFQPDVVILAHVGSGFTSAPSATQQHGGFAIGVMDVDGEQWASEILVVDAAGTSDTQRFQQTDACLTAINNALGVTKEASWVSMDSDGFTINYTTANSNAGRLMILALKGLNVQPGTFTKSTSAAPVTQTYSSVTFQPAAVLFYSFQNTAQANPVAQARAGFGASDGTTEGSRAVTDANGAGTSNTAGIDKTSKVFVKADNDTQTINAEADLTAFTSNGFSLTWTTNDAVATELLFLALGPLAPTATALSTFTAVSDGDGVGLRWRTGFEADNLGFHLYRDAGGVPQRITPSIVAGSTLFAGATALTAGRSYTWWDGAGTVGDRYWLEDIDVDGQRTWHGPVTAAAADASAPSPEGDGQAPLLAAVGRAAAAGPVPTVATALRPGVPATAGTRRRWPSQWQVAAQPGAKISVREPGWYRVDATELLAAGLDPALDPRTLRLFAEGRELPLAVDGEEDGQLDADDAVEFYGLARETPWTAARVYWIAGGARLGARLRTAPNLLGRGGAARSFPFTLEWKERSVYFAALHNGEEENFFGPAIESESVTATFALHHADHGAAFEARVEVALQGLTLAPHEVEILINGTPAGQARLEGRAHSVVTLAVPQTALVEGENQITLVRRGGELDVSLVDRVRLTYWHTYTADDDALHCTVPGGREITIGGFSEPDVRVVDVTNPDAPLGLRGRITSVAGGFAATVTGALPGPRVLFAFTAAAVKHPDAVVGNVPSNWHERQGGADLVMVTTAELADALEPLRAAREAQGLRVALVDVEDLYDELSFGAKTPWAIRDFLSTVQSRWQRPPRYLLLAGDASFDPKNHLGLGNSDLVPTMLVDTAFLETASDDWFTDRDGDGVADVPTGRLPLRTSAEAAAVVAKLVQYEQQGAPSGAPSALLVAGENDGFDFASAAERFGAVLPPAWTVDTVFSQLGDSAAARAALLQRFNEGPVLVSYTGHGSVEVWDGGGLFSAQDARGLTNAPRLSFVTAMTCLNGFFHDVYTESLAEALIKADAGGAVGVWASSGLTEPGKQLALNQQLAQQLTRAPLATLGEITRDAKATTLDADLRRTWMLFGDPTTRLRLP